MARQSGWRIDDENKAIEFFDRPELALEFLRRSPNYRKDYFRRRRMIETNHPEREETEAEFKRKWGLRFAHDPNVPVTQAPPVWLPEVAPTQLILSMTPGSFEGALRIEPALLDQSVIDWTNGDGRHFVIAEANGNHYGSLTQDAMSGSGCLSAIIPFDRDFLHRIAVVMRFYQRLVGGPVDALPRRLQLTTQRRARLRLMLDALDRHKEGVTRRSLAAKLFDPEAASIPILEWKSSALRRKVNRLITDALALIKGGYLKLLRGDWPYSDA